MSWTQAICERCWIEREGEWSAEDDSDTWQRLVSVRMPVRMAEPDLERCAYCGGATIVGIYVRDDPSKVAFPAEG